MVVSGGHDAVPALVAHTPNGAGEWHELVDHLTAVGALAEGFAARFGAGEWARLAGLWHDLGKANPAFRDYLIAADEGRPVPSPGHSTAGALLAADAGLDGVALAIAGHHAGLPWVKGLAKRLKEGRGDPGCQAARAQVAGRAQFDFPADVSALTPPVLGGLEGPGQRFCLELMVRMVFSALIDADRLDTEAHVSPERARLRQRRHPGLAGLLGRLRERHGDVTAGRAGDRVSDARAEIRTIVVGRAQAERPGLFTLTAPTGSGKTLTVLEAALAHAVAHGLDRVVFAVPFISVTEQVADVCRSVVDVDGDAVLEHHSNVVVDDGGQDPDALRRRLATEDWDMPVVVTTTVQLLESLFSNRPTACRKLHRLAGAVVVIDEAQSIPWRLIDPAARMLHQLTSEFGASVILCTATQPRFAELPALKSAGVEPRELLGEPGRWAPVFSRVEARRRPEPVGWDELVDEVVEWAGPEMQALVVLNTIADAEKVGGLVRGMPGAHLLTTRLCPEHRREVLASVRRGLEAGEPVLLASTQVVEAGIDVDFPVAFRAVGPVPSVVQVAGRVNRHGARPAGELVVFVPREGGLPRGEYETATGICRSFLARDGDWDLLAPATVDEHYVRLRMLLADELSREGIDERRRHLDYPEVAKRFRMVADDTVGVLVPFGGFDPAGIEAPALPGEARALLRRFQPYTVSLRRRAYDRAVADGLAVEVPGLPVRRWVGEYDKFAGLVAADDPTSTVL